MLLFLEAVNRMVWGAPALLMILGVGVALSVETRFAQLRMFPAALKRFLGPLFKKNADEDRSAYRALCTALAATVGTGNLAGVAGAIAIGGPGAVFWMWVCGFLGMVTKFAEATLSVRYRIRNGAGEPVGGPMYIILGGMEKKYHWLAGVYCFLGVVAAFGVGNATQINTVIGGVNSMLRAFGHGGSKALDIMIGVGLAVLITFLFLGGARRIGSATEKLVPLAAVGYIGLCAAVLWIKRDGIGDAFSAILMGAFSPKAVTGGVIASSFRALRVGASRGVFTNEAGMGTAAIAHGAANVEHPVEQGLMGIVEVFVDTILICTLTALVILSSGVSVPYGTDTGIDLTADAFIYVCGQWVGPALTGAVCLFAVATVIGWGLYGARCAQFLFGEKAWKWFVMLQAATVVLGAALGTQTLWTVSEIVNGLMAIPNLIMLWSLRPELGMLVRSYDDRSRVKRG